MDLQTFVADSLTAILSGVSTARQKNGHKLPDDHSFEYRSATEAVERIVEQGEQRVRQTTPAPFTKWELLRPIEFDVAVTVSSADKVIVNAVSETSTQTEKSSVTRIKFSVLAKI